MRETLDYLRSKTNIQPVLGLVLGSGLGDLVELVEGQVAVPYADIPGFERSTAPDHAGQLVFGTLKGLPCVLMCGRLHHYEGYAPERIVYPVRTLRALGVKQLILTNASGGINMGFSVGDLMLITDHINLSGMNPLIGPNDEAWGPRFPDMTYAYAPGLNAAIVEAAREALIPLRQGVYAMMSGPSFETPAEIRMLRTLGADAVGMSTVPEVIAANHCGLPVAAISCITNMAAGVLGQPLDGQEVVETGQRVKGKFMTLLMKTAEILAGR